MAFMEMKAMTKIAPAIKNVTKIPSIVRLEIFALHSKILNYFFSSVFLMSSCILAYVDQKNFAMIHHIAKVILKFA